MKHEITLNVENMTATVHATIAANQDAAAKSVSYVLDFSNMSPERMFREAVEARIVKVASVVRGIEKKTPGKGYEFAAGTIDVATMGTRKKLTTREKNLRAATSLGVDVAELEKLIAKANKAAATK